MIPPSAMENLELCPCFKYEVTDDLRAAGDEGTKFHDALEREDPSALASAYERSLWRWALDEVTRLEHETKGDTLTTAVLKEETLQLYGRRCRIDRLVLFLDGGVPVKALVVDYKTGRAVTRPAAEHAQMNAYFVAVMQKYPELQQVKTALIHPRLKITTTNVYQAAEESEALVRLLAIAARADAATFPEDANPNDQTCEKCEKLGKCPKAAAAFLKLAGLYDSHPAALDPSATPGAIAARQTLAPILESLAKSWKTRNTELAIEGGLDIPGYRVVCREPVRQVLDTTTAWTLLDRAGVTVGIEDLRALCAPTFKDLQALVSAKQGLSMLDAEDVVAAMLEPVISFRPPVRFLSKITKVRQ